jgi:hypothetical protein
MLPPMSSEDGFGFASFLFAIVAIYFLYVGFGSTTGIDGTANFELMHLQAANIAIGIGAAIVSAILAVGAAIISALRRLNSPA